jgi:hypothetical protein
MVKDAWVRFVERWGGGFGIGYGLVDRWRGGRFRAELDAVMWIKGIDWVDYARDGKDCRQQSVVEDGVLKGERGLDSALPETGEKHKEETELS